MIRLLYFDQGGVGLHYKVAELHREIVGYPYSNWPSLRLWIEVTFGCKMVFASDGSHRNHYMEFEDEDATPRRNHYMEFEDEDATVFKLKYGIS